MCTHKPYDQGGFLLQAHIKVMKYTSWDDRSTWAATAQLWDVSWDVFALGDKVYLQGRSVALPEFTVTF